MINNVSNPTFSNFVGISRPGRNFLAAQNHSDLVARSRFKLSRNFSKSQTRSTYFSQEYQDGVLLETERLQDRISRIPQQKIKQDRELENLRNLCQNRF